MPRRLTMFTFGYWGWGNATPQLVRSIDAVERHRGFRPPVFVDVRIHRSVRAAGFRDDVFERMLGPSRYKWMSDLGNRAVIGEGGNRRILIKEPSAARELLEVARRLSRQRRRVIFFCGCLHPGRCHRNAVARLLLRSAAGQGLNLRIVEWPGGEPAARPTRVQLADTRNSLGVRLPLKNERELPHLAGLPYGTLVHIPGSKSDELVPVGPARFAAKRWYLSVLRDDDTGSPVRGTARAVSAWRRRYGYDQRDSR